jgi:hypothetical protein
MKGSDAEATNRFALRCPSRLPAPVSGSADFD